VEPTQEQVDRGADAVLPFGEEWNLSLNPENLTELASAVLRHHDTAASWEEVDAEVRAQPAEWKRDREKVERFYRKKRST
jgi:hypothetical protein